MPRRRRKSATYEQILIAFVILLVASPVVLKELVPSRSIVIIILTACIFLALVVLFLAYWQSRRRRAKARALKVEMIDRMTGVEFERYVGELLRWRGFRNIQYTLASGDFGIDILATKDGDSYGVQVKRYKGKLDQRAVREAVAGMAKYKCTKAMVVTNSYFTPHTQELGRSNNCILIDRDVLGGWIMQFQAGHNPAD